MEIVFGQLQKDSKKNILETNGIVVDIFNKLRSTSESLCFILLKFASTVIAGIFCWLKHSCSVRIYPII